MALSLERTIWYDFNCFLHVEIFVEEPFFFAKKLLDERWEVVAEVLRLKVVKSVTVRYQESASLLTVIGQATPEIILFCYRKKYANSHVTGIL